MKIKKIFKDVDIQFTMSEKEAIWLKHELQNYQGDPSIEGNEHYKMRKKIL